MNRPEFALSQYRKATLSDPPNDDCVHIARGMGWVLIRDTKQHDGSSTDYRLAFQDVHYDAFQDAIRAHNVRTADIPAGALDGLCIAIDRIAPNINVFRSTVEQPGLPKNAVLVYTDAEIAAYFDGVHNHEFDADGDYMPHSADCAADCAEATHVALVAV